MQAVYYEAPRTFTVRDVPDPVPGDDEVLVRVSYSGVCHTDVNLDEGEFFASFPLVPGHEFTGRVAALGRGVEGLAVGDLVVCDNTFTCGACSFCRRGEPLFCEHFYSLGINGPGGAAEYVVVRGSKVFRVENRLTPLQAVFTEPLACAVSGADRARVRSGDRVLFYGAGASALLLGQLLRQGGAALMVVAAPPSPKLELAQRVYADVTVPMERDRPQAADRRLEDIAPHGFELVVDLTGSAAVQTHALSRVRPGGTLMIYGMARFGERVGWEPYTIFKNQLTVVGSFAQIFQFPRAIELLASGRVKVDQAVTDVLELAEYGRALDNVRNGRGIKTLLAVHPE